MKSRQVTISNLSEHIDNAVNAMNRAVNRRMQDFKSVSLGLSAGLDSRILLASGLKKQKDKFLTFTFGGKNNYDRDIAAEISKNYKIRRYW